MSKPIFIVKLPSFTTPEEADRIGFNLKNKMKDYHAMVIACNVNDVTFECYNTTGLDSKRFEELKELVKNYKTE